MFASQTKVVAMLDSAEIVRAVLPPASNTTPIEAMSLPPGNRHDSAAELIAEIDSLPVPG